jgi:hypothetical protein
LRLLALMESANRALHGERTLHGRRGCYGSSRLISYPICPSVTQRGRGFAVRNDSRNATGDNFNFYPRVNDSNRTLGHARFEQQVRRICLATRRGESSKSRSFLLARSQDQPCPLAGPPRRRHPPSALRARRDRTRPIQSCLRHDAGRLGFKTPRQSLSGWHIAGLDQGEEPSSSGHDPGQRCAQRSEPLARQEFPNFRLQCCIMGCSAKWAPSNLQDTGRRPSSGLRRRPTTPLRCLAYPPGHDTHPVVTPDWTRPIPRRL